MWLLRNDEKGLIYRVTPGKQHIVSRKDGDFLLVGDQSISRKHAQLFVDDENEDNGIVLKDLQSKYGTFTVIGEGELTQLTANQQVTLRSDDCVKFGIQWNIWRADFVPLLVATSTLTQQEKAEVKTLVAELGGQVVSDWQDKCTHLTMNKLTVTVKVVCALASCQPIVTPAYWKSFTQSLSSMQSTLPDCKDFLPPLAEAVLNPSKVSFVPNPARCKLFKDYTFVAATAKQLSRIKPMITSAGGNAVLFSTKAWTETRLLQDKTILMQHSANDRQGSQLSQIPDGYIAVARKLKEQGVRCIPEAEIGLSVLYCSLAQNCNPRFSAQALLGSNSQEATQPVNIICPDTEESTTTHTSQVDTVPGPSVSRKRAHENLSEDDVQESKRADVQVGSEDLFGSQHFNNTRTSKNSNGDLSLKKTTRANGSKDILKEKEVVNPDPSLDMFAPSYEKSRPSCASTSNQNEIKPSCEDLFSGSKQQKDKKANGNDEFSFITSKKSAMPGDRMVDGEDIFSFTSKKNTKNKQAEKMEDKDDEFSFTSNKRSKRLQERSADDEFSFSSEKRSNKRVRQSDPDMFASSVESSGNGSVAALLKIRKTGNEAEISFREGKRTATNDNLFAFPGDKSKRKRENDSLMNFDNFTSTEVKIALLSKDVHDNAVPGPSGLQTVRKDIQDEKLPEEKDLITYGKHIPAHGKIKQEINDEEVDELAKELHNATIVVVTPLVKVREKTANTTPVVGGKNFKKFHKAVGINKRVVPHIIGGSDLIPHNAPAECRPEDDLIPHLPAQPIPKDEWDFGKSKKKGKGH